MENFFSSFVIFCVSIIQTKEQNFGLLQVFAQKGKKPKIDFHASSVINSLQNMHNIRIRILLSFKSDTYQALASSIS